MTRNHFRQVNNLGPRHLFILERAEYLYNTNEYELSITQAEKIQLGTPNHSAAQLIKAKANFKLGKLNLALEQAIYLVKKEPSKIEAYLLAYQIYKSLKEYQNCKKILLQARREVGFSDILCPELEDLIQQTQVEIDKSEPRNYNGFKGANLFRDLPIDIIYEVFRYLYLRDLCRSTHVCKAWTVSLTQIPDLWTKLHFSFAKKTHHQSYADIPLQMKPFFQRAGMRLTHLTLVEMTVTESLCFPLYFNGRALNLNTLCLRGCSIEKKTFDRIITTLGNTLKVLDISGIKGIALNLVQLFCKCPNLTSLDLSSIISLDDQLIIESLTHFTNLPQLESLSLQGSILSRSHFSNFLKLFPNLKHLDISHSKRLGIETVQNICKFNKDIVSLGVSGLTSAHDLSFERCLLHLLSSCNQLQELKFANYPDLPDSLIRLSVGFTEILQCLDFSDCRLITNHALEAIALGCPNLTHLSLNGCPLITDEGVKPLLRYCPLKHLDLSFNPRITDTFFELLTTLPTSLVELVVENCAQLSARGLIPYCKHKNSRKLQLLNIGTINQLDFETLNWLKLRFGRIQFYVNLL